MKKMKMFVLLILLSAMTSGYSKHVAVKYNDFNVIFSGEFVANKKEQPVLTLKSLSGGLVCSGKPQVTEVMFFNYINPAYNGIFGKAYLSCNDGSKLLVNWGTKKMVLDKASGKAADPYGRSLSFYIDKNEVAVNNKLEQYKNDLANKPVLVDYRTYIKEEKPPVLIKEETSTPKPSVETVKNEEKPQPKVSPAVLKVEKKVQQKPAAVKNVKKVIPPAKPVVEKKSEKTIENKKEIVEPKAINVEKKQVKVEKEISNKVPAATIEKPVVKEIPAVIKKEENVSKNKAALEAPKAVEAEKNVVPVKLETKVPVKAETKIKSEEKKNQPDVKANVQPTPKEVLTTFTGDKQSEISELKKFKSNVEIKKEDEKIKKVNDSPGIAQPGNVFSLKNTLLKFNFGYNVSNPAHKF